MVSVWTAIFVSTVWMIVGFLIGWWFAGKIIYARLKYRYEQGEFRSTESFEEAMQEKEGKNDTL